MSDAPRSGWARLGTGIVVAFVIFFVVANREDLPDAWKAARDSDKTWLAGGVACMVGFLASYVAMHWGARHAAHVRSQPSRITLCALAGNFLNMVTKSGGFAGLAPFVGEAKRRNQAPGPAGTRLRPRPDDRRRRSRPAHPVRPVRGVERRAAAVRPHPRRARVRRLHRPAGRRADRRGARSRARARRIATWPAPHARQAPPARVRRHATSTTRRSTRSSTPCRSCAGASARPCPGSPSRS